MRTIYLASLIGISSLVSGCATIVHSDKQAVTLTAPDEEKDVKIKTPDGVFEVNKNTTVLLTRSHKNIPVDVTCSGKTTTGEIKTHLSGLAIFGNFFFGGIPGWVIDGVGSKAYDAPEKVDLAPYCGPTVKQALN